MPVPHALPPDADLPRAPRPSPRWLALCAALGLSRATFYRRRRAAVRAPSETPPPVAVPAVPDDLGGRSREAAAGLATEGATASPTAVLQAADADAAERLLSKINYQSNMTWSEKVPQNFAKNTANMLLSIFTLAGILIVFSVIVGLGLGGFRSFRRRGARGQEDPAMIVLDLRSK